MDWKNFRQLKGKSVQDYTHEFRRRQLKGQSVQDYTHEFRRKALILDINLYSHKTLLK